jgi:hypothetical protein
MCFIIIIIIIIIIALYCVVVFGYIDEYSGDMSLVLPICFEKIHSQTMLETILVSPTKYVFVYFILGYQPIASLVMGNTLGLPV